MQHLVMNDAFNTNSRDTGLIHRRVDQNAFSLGTIRAQPDRTLSGCVSSEPSPSDLSIDLVVEISCIDLVINKSNVVVKAFDC